MSLLRRLATLSFKTSNSIMRAPKKKKEGEAATEQITGNPINIFKDRPDEVLENINKYPLFVQYYSTGAYGYLRETGELAWLAAQGDQSGHPLPIDRKKFVRSFKRQHKKDRNVQVHDRRRRFQNKDKSSLTPGIQDPTFPDPFGDLIKYEQEQRKKQLEEQLALDDTTEEEEPKGPPPKRN